ncbi:MAG: magnesium chelatase ATPase subunit I [Pseudomonadota bacterium]
MKTALLLSAVDPTIGGVLVFGDRGTGKSTAVRALAQLLPKMKVVPGSPYNTDPATVDDPDVKSRQVPVPVVDLPLGATEDRVVGALDIEKALSDGERVFQPGLLAQANRGFLYIDEINLLEDHLVDLLLDVAASGENVVEREGLSVRHPARFVLIGSGNPEEGELRPQLLDRFGLSVDVATPEEVPLRIEVVKRRDAYDRDPTDFVDKWKRRDGTVRRSIVKARERLEDVSVPDEVLTQAAQLCMTLGTDGLRGELTLMRAARAQAALKGMDSVTTEALTMVAPMVLSHRLRRNPLDDSRASTRVERAVEEMLA